MPAPTVHVQKFFPHRGHIPRRLYTLTLPSPDGTKNPEMPIWGTREAIDVLTAFILGREDIGMAEASRKAHRIVGENDDSWD